MSSPIQAAVDYLNEWLPYQLLQHNIPGLQFAVAHKGEVVASGAFGFSDIERIKPLSEQHLFRVASQSKIFTATSIFQLCEKGELRLDDPLGKWLDWVPKGETSSVGEVTLRELLSHGGGVLRDGVDARFWGLERDFPGAAELQGLLGDAPATYPRNTEFKYSNFAYGLLGQVIEAVSGISYNEYVTQNIIQPLSMRNTGTDFDSSRKDQFADCHSAFRAGFAQRKIDHVSANAMAPATGVFSNARDMCVFMSSHVLGNEILISDDSKRAMQQPQWEVPGLGGHQGVGMRVREVDGRRIVGHGGNWIGHFTASYCDPKEQVAISILTNAIAAPAVDICHGTFKLLSFAEKQNYEEEVVDLAKFCGRFATLWGVFDIARFGDSLFVVEPSETSPTAYAIELEVVNDNCLRMVTPLGILAHGELMTFEFDEGQVCRIELGGDSIYPYEAFRTHMNEGSQTPLSAPAKG